MMDFKIAGPFIGMVLAECAQVGLMIVSKAAMSQGMSNLVWVCYSNALASLFLLPIALIFHRSQLPSLNFSLISQFFLLGFLGCFALILGYAGINYSSPTLGTAMLNLVPGFTFILAVIFRMEKLKPRSISSLAKSLGTLVSIAGAFVVTFYRGPAITMSSPSTVHSQLLASQQSSWIMGGVLLAADCVLTSAWVILQAFILKKYPAELIIVFFYCFFVAIQSAIIALTMEGVSSAWSLRSKTWLYAVLYSGVFGSAFQVVVATWCLQRTGPVFVSMFKPLGIVIAAVGGAMFLGDTFYIGSLVGSIIIVLGFYSVMWGKVKEAEVGFGTSVANTEPKSKRVPLLETIDEEV